MRFIKKLERRMSELQESLSKNSVAVDACAANKLQEACIIIKLSLPLLDDIVSYYERYEDCEFEASIAKKAREQFCSAQKLIEEVISGTGRAVNADE